ncbi:hypothetical protein FA10DRAFT_288657 [Acaromyces ingoldii]|uniref:Uncharacterized protein n=1 Tax=Acaromyces ingoldii TaxID=215250 RepID=A0A316YGJ4_9BASI|nr:hypothetical protein FA10DRAFT_288657 [Acaromyces ingoldii]PWN87964.1 hypothetical protein FA10DRAFT_288657 [Acaromyces ingoldii]
MLAMVTRAKYEDGTPDALDDGMPNHTMIEDWDSNVTCHDDHAGWSGDCAQLDDAWIKDQDQPGIDEQKNKIICKNLCCVVAVYRNGSYNLSVSEMAQWGNNANLHCNGPNEQTWISGNEDNWSSPQNGTWRMCLINKNSADKCK